MNMRSIARRVGAASLVILACACAHTEPGAMTVEEHRNAAAFETAQAQKEREVYEPIANREQHGPLASQLSSDLWVHDAPEQHLAAADAHQRHAHEHLRAAQTLERFEDSACRGVSTAARAACPMFTASLDRVEGIEGGVRLVLKTSAPAEGILAQMRCHLAYAQAQGFSKPTCPLYLKGAVVTAKSGAIDVVSPEAAVAARIRAEAQVMFGH